jgi:hypothetical protein
MENGRARDRDRDGRFSGAHRINVEDVSRLSTFPARWTLADPRGRSYLAFWTSRDDGSLFLGVRMEAVEHGTAIRISDPDGRQFIVKIVRRPLPRKRGVAILYRCPWCGRPRRYLYPLTLVLRSLVTYQGPLCQTCAGFQWASRGSYRHAGARGFSAAVQSGPCAKAPYPRGLWDPRAVSDPRMLIGEFPTLRFKDASGPRCE